MIEIRGTHGTCVSRAERIAHEGTMAKGPGRVGFGAYFWTAVNDSESCRDYVEQLAKGWATRAHRMGQYKGERDQNLAIVRTVIEIGEEEFFSLDDPEFLYRLREFLGQNLVEHFRVGSTKELDGNRLHRKEEIIHGIIEAFIVQLEKTLDTTFKVVFKSVPAPNIDDPLLPFIGNPHCFAIRDLSIIKNLEITKL